MQLDNTRIAVRERGFLETLDLTLQVMRVFAPRLVPALLLGIVPFAIVDQLLIGWMWVEPTELANILDDPSAFMSMLLAYAFLQDDEVTRFGWYYLLLVFFQAPAATIFAVSYLGGAVFQHERRLNEIASDVFKVFWPFFWTQLMLRGVIVIMVMPLFNLFGEFNPLIEIVIPLFLIIFVAGLRSVRPFINEIVVLERNPLTSKQPGAMTIGKRSKFLHENASGDLIAQWIGSCLISFIMLQITFWSLWLIYSVMFGDSQIAGWVPQHILRPAALWIVVAYMSVARFLSYLDLRIRQEGWEVELLIKAEANRLQEKLV